MTPREKTLIFFDDFLKELGIDYMIFASTLLGIVREGKMLEHDTEIDLCVRGKDITNKQVDQIKASGYYTGLYNCKEKFGELYIAKEGYMDATDGWVAISHLWVKNNTGYINIEGRDCITMHPRYHNKDKWGTLKYIGREFKCPQNPKRWLKEWYGDDWETPKAGHWKENTNRKLWGDI